MKPALSKVKSSGTVKPRSLKNDPEKCASAAHLIYVNTAQRGITRKRSGKNFSFFLNGKKISDKTTITRIKALVLPPAWKEVWICPFANGHLQATGIDAKGRKQYRYHASWSAMRSATKFYRLLEFGCALKQIRPRLEKDLALAGLPLNKVLATVVSLMLQTGARPGSDAYEREYGSYGLTTLKDRHVTFKKDEMIFSFRGKKGIEQKIGLQNKRLARIVRQCREVPGKELFQYYDEKGNRSCIDSGLVNQYISAISGGDFTAKDFRTWVGTVRALTEFSRIGQAMTKKNTHENIVRVLDAVAQCLGNTRTVCKKYYVHPLIIDHYEKGSLQKYVDTASRSRSKHSSEEETSLLRILGKQQRMVA